MCNDYFKKSSMYIGINHATRTEERFNGFESKFNTVLESGRLPEIGFSEVEIECILHKLALMDSNNWSHSTGVGEREGRILLELVKRRHYGLVHGIGRSGDVTAIQPKASGSSLINRLVNILLLDWLRRSGTPSTQSCILVPMATGMSLTFCLLTLKRLRGAKAKYVLWPRIDQKSCLKCITAAGLIPIPIEPIKSSGKILKGMRISSPTGAETHLQDQLSTNLPALLEALKDPTGFLASRDHSLSAYADQLSLDDDDDAKEEGQRPGPESIVAVLSTTSCFSPRVPDRIVPISRICADHGVPHLVNNAYGVQLPRCMRMLESSWKEISKGTVSGDTSIVQPPIDLLYVQSTDKNLMVPVGGAIIAGFSGNLIKEIAESYPGRASGTPALDVFATLLFLGWRGWKKLVDEREVCYRRLAGGLQSLADKYPTIRLMQTPDNPISLALCLNDDDHHHNSQASPSDPHLFTQLGARLFTQGCSGVRVVTPASMETKADVFRIAGLVLPGFGSHSATSMETYLNAAAAIGQTGEEVDLFLTRLDKALSGLQKNIKPL